MKKPSTIDYNLFKVHICYVGDSFNYLKIYQNNMHSIGTY